VFIKKIMICVIVGLIFPLFLFSNNRINNSRNIDEDRGLLNVQRGRIEENIERRVHPFQDWFDEQRVRHVPNTRSSNFNRLLVLLVDFQEDDNPLTTGNGKFILEPDPNFPIPLGSPP